MLNSFLLPKFGTIENIIQYFFLFVKSFFNWLTSLFGLYNFVVKNCLFLPKLRKGEENADLSQSSSVFGVCFVCACCHFVCRGRAIGQTNCDGRCIDIACRFLASSQKGVCVGSLPFLHSHVSAFLILLFRGAVSESPRADWRIGRNQWLCFRA